MCSLITSKSKMISEIMKFSLHHRAFYCYLGMSIWIFFLITIMYRYISLGEDVAGVKKMMPKEYVSKNDVRFHKIYLNSCNPPDNIIRGAEGAVDNENWLLQGAVVVTRHGDRGPLTHLKRGDRLPCDTLPHSPLLRSYWDFVRNASGGVASGAGRPPWVQAAGPFHNFPTLPARAAGGGTSCALGQLTPLGILQMLRVGLILNEAYAEKLNLQDVAVETNAKREPGDVVSYSTRYRRTYQSLVAVLWALGARALPGRAARVRESHSVSFCFRECACPAQHDLVKKINSQTKHRLSSHTAIKDLVDRVTKVIFESQEHVDAEVARDAILAYMCHAAPLPCTQKPISNDNQKQEILDQKAIPKYRRLRALKQNHRTLMRSLLEADMDNQNIEFDYNGQLDFDNEIGRKARDIIGKYDTKPKAPLDFDAQMEREKLLYYQQRYMDNAENYDDVVIVKKHLDADFNFPNDQRIDQDFEEESYKEVTTEFSEEVCVKKDHIIALYAYRDWSHRRDMSNFDNRRRGTLIAYGLIHNIVQNIIRMISENKPKLVIYSGHDKTLQALILALGVRDHKLYDIHYASRMIFEIYRKKELRDEYKFAKRKAVAQDFYFRIVFNGEDITAQLSFCKPERTIAMKVVDALDDSKINNSYLCPIESIVRFIHDDYFSIFNASNFKDACSFYTNDKRVF